LTNLSGGIEHAYVRERSIRLRWQLVPEIANQVDYVNRIDRVGGLSASGRLRDILSNGVTFDLSYRPQQNAELGFKIDVSRATDRFQTPELEANLNAQSVRITYAFQGSGQARAELVREEVQLARAVDAFPFELTGGRVSGKTWIWRAAFEYRMTQFLQATMNYEGRAEGGGSPVHTARAEVRAFF
jgi:ABC-type arginine transport system ATPase subunit